MNDLYLFSNRFICVFMYLFLLWPPACLIEQDTLCPKSGLSARFSRTLGIIMGLSSNYL